MDKAKKKEKNPRLYPSDGPALHSLEFQATLLSAFCKLAGMFACSTHLGARADSCSHALGGFDRFQNSVAIALKIKRNTWQRSCRYRKKRHDGKIRLPGPFLVARSCAEETTSFSDCLKIAGCRSRLELGYLT